MFPDDFLTLDRIHLESGAASKKRILEEVAGLLAATAAGLTREQVFDKLLERERLGSTGLGQGIALPHARMKGVTGSHGALVRLRQGVDFDAIDAKPVDIVVGLLVPEQATDEHLQLLASLAARFSDPTYCDRIRQAPDPAAVLELFRQAGGDMAASA